jgi:hypothetical protein
VVFAGDATSVDSEAPLFVPDDFVGFAESALPLSVAYSSFVAFAEELFFLGTVPAFGFELVSAAVASSLLVSFGGFFFDAGRGVVALAPPEPVLFFRGLGVAAPAFCSVPSESAFASALFSASAPVTITHSAPTAARKTVFTANGSPPRPSLVAAAGAALQKDFA